MSPEQQVSVKTEAQETPTAAIATASAPAPTLSNLLSPKSRPAKPTYSKAQLIEQQLQTDQNGANSPDISTPFASKADACKRLVRYHCYNQPVLSEKDLNKADEIFELTARHFIGKFQGMVNKYKYLLLKESMREVPTSELMMIDRMFLAEEQQSFLKLQSDLKLQHDLEQEQEEDDNEENVKAPSPSPILQDEEEEDEDDIKGEFELTEELLETTATQEFVSVKQEDEAGASNRTDFNIKCGVNYFADESCDSVYEEGGKQQVASCHPKKADKGKGDGGGLESYNTTKIIGNFEIEINNKGCSSQESYTKNFRQKIIDNKAEGRAADDGGGFDKADDYDEWLCIQRELGYLSSDSGNAHVDSKDMQDAPADQKKAEKGAQKRNTNDNRLETLKKFRVEKHNSKSKKSGGSIIGEVKFEVRIEHKKVGAPKRAHYEFQSQTREEGVKRAKNEPPLQQQQQQHHLQIKQEEEEEEEGDAHYLQDSFLPELLEDGSPDGLIDTSIDEQVQSAIDSILNLQQIASMTEQQKEAATTQQQQQQQVTCRNINTLTAKGGCEEAAAPDLSAFNSETLDDAVKSILS